MARRWQLSLWVLAGLALTVVALWDNATVSAVADRVTERTETVDGADRAGGDDPSPADLAFGELDGTGSNPGGSNLLRPTTTTTTRPTTTTTSTTVPPADSGGGGTDGDGSGPTGEHAPGSATTIPTDGDGESPGTTGSGGSSSTAANGSSTTAGGPIMATVYEEDFAEGALVDGRWSVANSAGVGGWGLLRPSSVAVVADPAATGGHVLAITARMGSGAEADRVVSGAVRLLGQSLTYGRYTIRARVDVDPDGATAGVVLLQPTSAGDTASVVNEEIRILDTTRNRSNRAPVESTVHWRGTGATTAIRKAHSTSDGAVSAATWHVYTLDWSADRVSVALDGRPLTLTVDPGRVPQGPMDLSIRLDPIDSPSTPGEQPVVTGEVRLLVDWIRLEGVSGEQSS